MALGTPEEASIIQFFMGITVSLPAASTEFWIFQTVFPKI